MWQVYIGYLPYHSYLWANVLVLNILLTFILLNVWRVFYFYILSMIQNIAKHIHFFVCFLVLFPSKKSSVSLNSGLIDLIHCKSLSLFPLNLIPGYNSLNCFFALAIKSPCSWRLESFCTLFYYWQLSIWAEISDLFEEFEFEFDLLVISFLELKIWCSFCLWLTSFVKVLNSFLHSLKSHSNDSTGSFGEIFGFIAYCLVFYLNYFLAVLFFKSFGFTAYLTVFSVDSWMSLTGGIEISKDTESAIL